MADDPVQRRSPSGVVDRRALFGHLGAVAAGAPILSASAQTGARSSPTDTSRSVRAFGAQGNGVTPDSRAIQDAIDRLRHVQLPHGRYVIDQPLRLRGDTTVEFLDDAQLTPATAGMTIFTSAGLTPRSRIVNPRISAGGTRGVTAFDLVSFRNGCVIERPWIENCHRGIVLRSLCWDMVIMQPTIIRTSHPIVIQDRSNAVDIFHPAIDGYETGLTIDGSGGVVTSTRVWGGYFQNGVTGIKDQAALGTLVYGTYFEGNREVDIDLQASLHATLDSTQHYERSGNAAIRARRSQGVSVSTPLMASGGRRIGLFDFDASNEGGVTLLPQSSNAAINRPLGLRGGLAEVVLERSGRFRPRLAGSLGPGNASFTTADGRWRVEGTQATVAIDLAWSNHSGRGGAVIRGAPPSVLPQSYTPRLRHPVVAEGFSLMGRVLVAELNGEGTDMALVAIDGDGQTALLPVPTAGRISFTCSYSLAV